MGLGSRSLFAAVAGLGVIVSSGIANAAGGTWSGFVQGGYLPQDLLSDGRKICGMDSSGLNMRALRNSIASTSVELKRELLIQYAVGFADTYNFNYFAKKVADSAAKYAAAHPAPRPQWARNDPFWGLDPDDLMKCNKGNSACDGSATAIRSVAGFRSDDSNWCAMFVSALSSMVDRQAKGGPSNLLHTGKGTNARNFASAKKLLAIFDPAVSLQKNRALFCAPHSRCYLPPKAENAFLQPDQRPIPGCMAVYLSADGREGHMGLVINVTGSGSAGRLDTIEGNSRPKAGSSDRGVFLHPGRVWGRGAAIASNDGRTTEKLYYRGCVMPWPDMLPGQSLKAGGNFRKDAGCSAAVSDTQLKPGVEGYMQTHDPQPKAGSIAGTLSQFFKNW